MYALIIIVVADVFSFTRQNYMNFYILSIGAEKILMIKRKNGSQKLYVLNDV